MNILIIILAIIGGLAVLAMLWIVIFYAVFDRSMDEADHTRDTTDHEPPPQ